MHIHEVHTLINDIKQRNRPQEPKTRTHLKTAELLSSRNSVRTCFWSLSIFLIRYIFLAQDLPPSSHITSSHIFLSHFLFFIKSAQIKRAIFFESFLSFSCFGLLTSIKFSNWCLRNFKCFKGVLAPQIATLTCQGGINWGEMTYALAILQHITHLSANNSLLQLWFLYFCVIVLLISVFSSLSYPLRSWWAPVGAAAWWRRTPAPQCPQSAAPLSPRWRSALLRPQPTPCHHVLTRNRSLSRPPRPRGRRHQDQRSHPALYSSSPAPTPARHGPRCTGRAPSGTRLLSARSLNPVWVRLRWDGAMSKKYWPQVCKEPEVIRDLSNLEGSLRI